MDESVCTKCGTPVDAGLIFCKTCGAALPPPEALIGSIAEIARKEPPAYADAIGLGLIAVELTVLFWWLVPDDGTRFLIGIIAYGMLVALALALWHGKEAKRFSDAYDWAGLFAGSVLLGALSFGVDMIVGSLNHPGMSPLLAGTKAGSPFGFVLTIFLCPGVTIVAVAGLVSLIPHSREQRLVHDWHNIAITPTTFGGEAFKQANRRRKLVQTPVYVRNQGHALG